MPGAYADWMKLDRSVHLVGGGAFGVSHFSDSNIYAVNCGDSTMLIDAGCGIATEVLAENVEAEGLPPISHVLLTHSHWDHARGLAWLDGGLFAALERLRALRVGQIDFAIEQREDSAAIVIDGQIKFRSANGPRRHRRAKLDLTGPFPAEEISRPRF